MITKGIIISVILVCSTFLSAAKCQGTFLDKREMKSYNTVKISDLIWFAENLNFNSKDSECYELDSINCDKYGRLYTFYESEKVCPENWRLPNKRDIRKLKKEMKSRTFESIVDQADWETKEADIGTNELGLSIKPGGRKYDKEYIPKTNNENPFFGKGICASFWLGGEEHENPRHWHINHFGGSRKMKIHRHGTPPKGAKLSILCVKDDRE